MSCYKHSNNQDNMNFLAQKEMLKMCQDDDDGLVHVVAY